MCVAVAAECGPGFPAVLEQPYALTLWTYHQLSERDRIANLIEHIDAVNTATLTALAFNDPQKLSVERENALAVARSEPSASLPDEEWRARAAKLVAALEEGGVLSDA